MTDITLTQIRSELTTQEPNILRAARLTLVGAAAGLAVLYVVAALLAAQPSLRPVWLGGLIALALLAPFALPKAQAWLRRRWLKRWLAPQLRLPGKVIEACAEWESLPPPLEACVNQALRAYAGMEEMSSHAIWRQRPPELRPHLKQLRDAMEGFFLNMVSRAQMVWRYVSDLQDAEREQRLRERYERRLAECQRFAQDFERARADLVEMLVIAQDDAWRERGLSQQVQKFSRHMDAIAHAMRETEKTLEPSELFPSSSRETAPSPPQSEQRS